MNGTGEALVPALVQANGAASLAPGVPVHAVAAANTTVLVGTIVPQPRETLQPTAVKAPESALTRVEDISTMV